MTILLSACNVNINVNQPTGTPSPEPTTEETAPVETLAVVPSIEEQLTQFFADKFSKPLSDVILTVSQKTDTHATGGIRFTGDMGGGMWLAHLDGDTWLVDYDGNGTIPCDSVEPHNYPTSILTECWDESSSSLKTLP